jgi:hypothetical protein
MQEAPGGPEAQHGGIGAGRRATGIQQQLCYACATVGPKRHQGHRRTHGGIERDTRRTGGHTGHGGWKRHQEDRRPEGNTGRSERAARPRGSNVGDVSKSALAKAVKRSRIARCTGNRSTPHHSSHEAITPAGRSTPQCPQEPFCPPKSPHSPHFHTCFLLPFMILKENFHCLAVLNLGHHGPVVFALGDGTDVDSDLACLRPHVCSDVHLNNRANGGGGFFFRGINLNTRFPIIFVGYPGVHFACFEVQSEAQKNRTGVYGATRAPRSPRNV